MATTQWIGGAPLATQVETCLVTAAANNGTLTATVGLRSIVYTMTNTDTTATAATAFFDLLTAAGVAPEFGELTFANPSAGVITTTSPTPGYPFTITFTAAAGAALTQTHTTANSSPSDVGNAANWLRSGVASLPQTGDDLVVANSKVPLLWNLNALAAVLLNSYTRYQSFTAQIGLPLQNTSGYLEYRPTKLQLGSNVTTLSILLGVADSGTGPTRERYDFQTYRITMTALAAGSPADTYSVYAIGSHVSNVVNSIGVSVGFATEIASTGALASASVDGGGTLALGPGVTFSGTLTATSGTVLTYCAPATINAYAGSQVTVAALGLTYAAVVAENGSTLTWLSNSTITALTLRTGSVLDKSQDPRAMTLTNATIDGDTCRILDPLDTITFSNPITVHNQVNSGPVQFTERTLQVI